MAADEKWYFTKEQLANTPSRRCGIDADKELSYRQQAANFIQDMGQRLVVTQLCINTAIVYMHRFYVFHSLSQFHRNAIAAAALFLAAKVEEQPRKLEHVIKVAHMCLHRDQNTPDPKSDQYLEQAQDLVFNENVLLQTLGFDVAIDHPHTHVVRCCQLVKGMDDIGASKDLAQTSYFMASNSLHLTTMCLQYKPTVVACFCIHLACKWSNWEIPQSNEGKYWFWYVDRTVTAELLQQLTAEFLHIFDRCPSRLKKKIMSISEKQSPSMHHPSLPNSPFDVEPRKVNSPAPDGGPTFQSSRPFPQEKDEKKPSTSGQSRLPQLDAREYREKKERERLEREKLSGASGIAQLSHSNTDPQKHHSHHHKGPASSSQNPLIPGKHPPSLPQKSNPHHSHHHRPDPKLVQQQAAQRHPQSRQRPPPPVQPGIPYNPHSHPNPQNHQKDMNSMIDTSAGSSDLVQSHQEPQSHQSLDKSGNNNHSLHRRSYDPRHKLLEHRKEDPKNYQKYGDQMRVDRQRKPDSLEQRSEEVRKLIEKPLPPPKPRQDQQPHHHQQPPQQPQQSQQQSGQSQKEDYAAAMLKQSSHHSSKYHEKLPTHNTGRNALPPDYSKFPVPHKQQPSSGLLGHSQSVQNLPKDLKNGAVEDVKCDKRPRLETENPIPSLPVKHKSLFSPEKVPPSRETIIPSKTKLPKQKTPPMVQVKAIKQERIPEISGTLDFTSSTLPTSPQPIQVQRRPKIPDISITEPDASQMRLKMEDPGNFDIMKMFGKIPEPTLSLRDIPGSTNGRGPSSGQQVNEHLKISNKSENLDSKHTLTNGMESLGFRNESHHLILDKLDSGPMKTEYLSPMKSVQGISALLQEPLAPMPSLLSQSSDSGNFSQTFSQASIPQHSESIHQSSEPSPRTGPPVKEEFAASTVDISVLSGPAQVLPEISASSNPPLQHSEKKSEHHKSEKKKKKEKHKHKDKDKSKEKHKHKHKDKEKDKDKDKDKEKDKEKEKERDKDKHKEKSQKSEDNSTMPIKITIAKDKLNLSTDNSSSQERKSPKLMLKKPKERLKHETSVQPMSKDIQGSLKIKIRTSGGVVEFPESRKRERERENIDGGPAAKKSTSGSNQGFPGQQQRTTERQNGRHYGSGSNKEKHSREHKSSSKLSQSQQSHAT